MQGTRSYTVEDAEAAAVGPIQHAPVACVVSGRPHCAEGVAVSAQQHPIHCMCYGPRSTAGCRQRACGERCVAALCARELVRGLVLGCRMHEALQLLGEGQDGRRALHSPLLPAHLRLHLFPFLRLSLRLSLRLCLRLCLRLRLSLLARRLCSSRLHPLLHPLFQALQTGGAENTQFPTPRTEHLLRLACHIRHSSTRTCTHTRTSAGASASASCFRPYFCPHPTVIAGVGAFRALCHLSEKGANLTGTGALCLLQRTQSGTTQQADRVLQTPSGGQGGGQA
mmetsp:Transcript_25222/g.54534  ORF Transcript_25222/g.54534 Transcript_25222/m.54534 type:complete len:282 (-) Transcript_25222:214-1059(-)